MEILEPKTEGELRMKNRISKKLRAIFSSISYYLVIFLSHLIKVLSIASFLVLCVFLCIICMKFIVHEIL